MKTKYDTTFLIVDPRQTHLSVYDEVFDNFETRTQIPSYVADMPIHSMNDAISGVTREYSNEKTLFFPVFMPKIHGDPGFHNSPSFFNKHSFRHNEIIEMLSEYKGLLERDNVIPLLIDTLESNPFLVEILNLGKKHFPNGVMALSADFLQAIQYDNVYYFSHWLSKMPVEPKLIDYTPKRLYVNLTRAAHSHRVSLMEKLISRGLDKHGYNTWSNVYNLFERHLKNNPDSLLHGYDNFDVLDIEDLVSNNPNNCFPREACGNSFLFLVSETNVNTGQLFFSEKVFKPIAIGMPFLLLGNPGSLAVLREMGFVTFDQWWDESYDHETSLCARIEAILDILEFLSCRTNDLKIEWRKEMQPVLQHNQDLYRLISHKNQAKEVFNRIKQEWEMKR